MNFYHLKDNSFFMSGCPSLGKILSILLFSVPRDCAPVNRSDHFAGDTPVRIKIYDGRHVALIFPILAEGVVVDFRLVFSFVQMDCIGAVCFHIRWLIDLTFFSISPSTFIVAARTIQDKISQKTTSDDAQVRVTCYGTGSWRTSDKIIVQESGSTSYYDS